MSLQCGAGLASSKVIRTVRQIGTREQMAQQWVRATDPEQVEGLPPDSLHG